LAEVRAAEAVEKEVDDVVGGGDDVGDLSQHHVRQLLGRRPRPVWVLHQSVNQSINQASNQSIDRSIDQSIIQSINQSKKSINQSASQSVFNQ